jgi:four helix bundle protein
MQDYRNLRVWQKAHALAVDGYAECAHLNKPNAWPLRSQLFRALISVPSNIAEGCGRGSDPDFRRFLLHALGSLNEVEYDLLLARDLGFLPAVEHTRLSAQVEEVRRMLSGLIASLTP